MQSKATTVEQYLAELPEDRRAAVAAVREVILKNLDKDYVEGMSYGMIGYSVPHSVYPPGYHCDPSKGLPFAGLASQKNHMSLYLMPMYAESAEEKWFRGEFAKAGKKLDMGKCCVRFKKLEDLLLDVVGEAVRRTPAKDLIRWYEKIRSEGKSAAKKPATKTATPAKSVKATTKTKAQKAGSPSKPAAAKKAARSTVAAGKGGVKKAPTKKAPTKKASGGRR